MWRPPPGPLGGPFPALWRSQPSPVSGSSVLRPRVPPRLSPTLPGVLRRHGRRCEVALCPRHATTGTAASDLTPALYPRPKVTRACEARSVRPRRGSVSIRRGQGGHPRPRRRLGPGRGWSASSVSISISEAGQDLRGGGH